MTGLATSSGPTLLGKLRALENRYNATVDDYDGNQSAVNYAHQCAAHDLADLLPQIIAQIERDEKSKWAPPPGYALIHGDALRAWGKYDEVFGMCRYAIDAAKERT